MAALIHKIRTALLFQLLLAAVSYALLSAWSLPFSLLSLVLTIVMMPVVALFLCMSMLIFFTALLGIPNQYLVFILSKISLILTLPTVIIPTPCSMAHPVYFPCFLVCVGVAFGSAVFPRLRNKLMFVAMLSVLFGAVYFFASPSDIDQLSAPCDGITLVKRRGAHALVVGSSAKSRGHAFVLYDLVPALVGKGVTALDYVVICRPTAASYLLVLELAATLPVRTVIHPAFSGLFCRTGWDARYRLLQAAQRGSFVTHEISDEPFTTPLAHDILVCQPGKFIKKNRLKYRGLKIAIKDTTVYDEFTSLVKGRP